MKLFSDVKRLYQQVRSYVRHRKALRELKIIKRDYVPPKIDLVELRKELLEGMCHCSENISTRREDGGFFLTFEGGYFPTSFKPSVADKFLFQRMIDENLPKIVEEREQQVSSRNPISMGYSIFVKRYLPQYGWCDDREKEDALRE